MFIRLDIQLSQKEKVNCDTSRLHHCCDMLLRYVATVLYSLQLMSHVNMLHVVDDFGKTRNYFSLYVRRCHRQRFKHLVHQILSTSANAKLQCQQ